MAEQQPPNYLQAECYSAQDDRAPWDTLICQEGKKLGTMVPTSSGMTTTIGPGSAFVKGDTTSLQGMYHVVNATNTSVTHAAADPTSDRFDYVVAQIHDAQYSGTVNDWQVEIVQGVPGGGAPAIPANALPIALARITAGATSVSVSEASLDPYYIVCAEADEMRTITRLSDAAWDGDVFVTKNGFLRTVTATLTLAVVGISTPATSNIASMFTTDRPPNTVFGAASINYASGGEIDAVVVEISPGGSLIARFGSNVAFINQGDTLRFTVNYIATEED